MRKVLPQTVRLLPECKQEAQLSHSISTPVVSLGFRVMQYTDQVHRSDITFI